ncbi:MAG: hypothetical protein AAF824_03715 [Bacteroidota bacterium]
MQKLPFQLSSLHLVLVFVAFLICLSACDLDDNTTFLEETQTGYLLHEKQTGEKNIFFLSEAGILPSWNEVISLADREVSDIASFQQELWVASAATNAVIEVNALSGTLSRKVSLPDFAPDFIGVGEDMILLADSSRNEALFLDKRNEEIIRVSIPAVGGRIGYKSRKFYLQAGPSTLMILSEDALAEITRLPLARTITDIQADASVSMIVSTADSMRFQAVVNYNTNSFEQEERSVSHQKIRPSPFSRQLYGKEQLQTFTLTDNFLQPVNLQQIQDFEVDFFENHLWVLRNDSLYQVFEDGNFQFQLACEDGSLLKSYFFQDFVGD